MSQKVFIVDPRKTTPEEMAQGMAATQLVFKLNHTIPSNSDD